MLPEQVWDWQFCLYRCVFFVCSVFCCLVLSMASWGSVHLAVFSSSWECRFLYSYERYNTLSSPILFRLRTVISSEKYSVLVSFTSFPTSLVLKASFEVHWCSLRKWATCTAVHTAIFMGLLWTCLSFLYISSSLFFSRNLEFFYELNEQFFAWFRWVPSNVSNEIPQCSWELFYQCKVQVSSADDFLNSSITTAEVWEVELQDIQ